MNYKYTSKQHGFTLLELMIVVAIIGILAALAIPAYSDYTKRASAAEALHLMSGSKAAVAEYYAAQGSWPADNAAAGIADASDIKGHAVISVTVSGEYITALVNQRVESGKKIVFKATDSGGGIHWNCEASVSGTDVSPKYLPSQCR